jgi:hypothetical protein
LKTSKELPRIRLTLWSWEPQCHGLGCRFLWGLIQECHCGIAVPVLCAFGNKYKPIKTIGFTTDTETKIKAINGFRLWEINQCICEVSLCENRVTPMFQ